VLSIQEEERRSVSRELHDDIGQSLTALKIGLHRLAQRAGDEHKELIAECLAISGTTLDKLRNLSLKLRPPQLDQLGLEDALEWLASRQNGTTGLDVGCEFVGLEDRLPAKFESVCYRIAQEALNNATRHASARQIRIRVERNDGLLTLEVRDDGTGFDMDAARKKAIKSGSLGLISMEERAQLAGGKFEARSVVGSGTTILATFMLHNETGDVSGGQVSPAKT
jgi:signal transduction histidine kinase